VELIQFSEEQLAAYLGSFFWPLFRISGFMMAAPVLGSQLVPMRIKLIIAVAVTVVVTPLLPAVPEVAPLSLSALALVLQQLLIGVALGFFLQLVFQTMVLAGQMIAMQMGLGFASMMDPTNGVNVTVVSSFYLMFVTVLFVAFDGHLQMIRVLVESFYTVPMAVDFSFIDNSVFPIVNALGWVFSSAMILALPAITALLISNFAFGIMTRAAPQLNMFALGFPVALMFGLFLIWLTFPTFTRLSGELFNEAFEFMGSLINFQV
jgi:flagellar biosynthetic protein FliR